MSSEEQRKDALKSLRDARLTMKKCGVYEEDKLCAKLSQETKDVLMQFAKEVHDSLEKGKFINMVPVDAFFSGFMQQDGKTVREYMRNNASNGYHFCGWSLDYTLDYLEGVIGTRPHFEFWPYMEDYTDIGLVIRNDLSGFETKCKSCYDLRLKAETSCLMCFNHVDDALLKLGYLSEKKEDMSMIRVEHFHNSYQCQGHCFHGDAHWIFALKKEDLSFNEDLKALSERATDIMACYQKARNNNYSTDESCVFDYVLDEEEQTSPKKQKIN